MMIVSACLASTAQAGSYTARVLSPNGVDDTASIQAALDACVAHGSDCTVQLAAGTDHTRQLVAYNFYGTFKGQGMNNTTIEALPYLPVTLDFLQPCQPNTTTCLWPTLMIFVDGNIRISDLKSMGDGVSQDGCVRSSQVSIGGSPATGNSFEDHYVAIDMESAENSNFEILYNVASGIGYSMWVVPWIESVFLPSKPSRYLIHDNTFFTTDPYATGILLYNDTPDHPWIDAVIWNNSIQLQNTLSDGIDAVNTKGTTILNNSVTGSGFDAIGLWGSRSSTVIRNSVSDYTPDISLGLAQIYLDPATTRDLVVCSTPSDSVLNQGSDNVVVGCQQPATMPQAETRSEVPGSPVPDQRFPRWKPSPFRP